MDMKQGHSKKYLFNINKNGNMSKKDHKGSLLSVPRFQKETSYRKKSANFDEIIRENKNNRVISTSRNSNNYDYLTIEKQIKLNVFQKLRPIVLEGKKLDPKNRKFNITKSHKNSTKITNQTTTINNQTTKIRPKSNEKNLKQFQLFDRFKASDFILDTDHSGRIFKQDLNAYWASKMKKVSLFRAQSQDILEMIKGCRHKSIIETYGAVELLEQGLCTVTQFIKENRLINLIKQFGIFSECITSKYIKQVINGCIQLEEIGILYMKLTPENIYIRQNGHAFINISKSTFDDNYLHFSPPQSLFGQNNNEQQKIWFIGCLTLLMLTGRDISLSVYHPYNNFQIPFTLRTKLNKYGHHQLDKNQLNCQPISAKAEHFIKKCLSINVNERFTYQNAIEHLFLLHSDRNVTILL